MRGIRKLAMLLLCSVAMTVSAKSRIWDPNVKGLTVVVNKDWLSPAVMKLGAGDMLNVGFDELSHTYHRYIYRLEHCEADWSPSEEVFQSDWLEGFNDNPIEDYENSLNTTVLYTHYKLKIPNERCRLKMSGNYRLKVYDEEDMESEVLRVEFRVVEPLMNVGLSVTTNTDIDFNQSHQQVSMTVNYGALNLTNEDTQLYTVVMQNGREDTERVNVKPDLTQVGKLQWEHNRGLIFDAGNEYHKFEVLEVSHPTLGIDRMWWDGEYYHAFPFANNPRRSYVYDQDANGAFIIRNSDNSEVDRTCDYVWVNYKILPCVRYDMKVMVDGQWATEDDETYVMTYDEEDQSYNARILQKQGYYSYQYVLRDEDGTTHVMPEEGSFFETENRYQAYVYYKSINDRTWRLTGYQQIVLK